MKRLVLLRPEAEDDVAAAFVWYERQLPGLGRRFLEALVEALTAVGDNPELYPEQYRRARRVLLRRFPYAIFYVTEPAFIDVVACNHMRRSPRRWRRRL
ncbi:type II toxin-antitoxin system RelE/ParE family toxin [Longimicrobium terrae]|nr:type II toxin-antitoxin system RelE/ParE family toxin [Longimicrobium terrae]